MHMYVCMHARVYMDQRIVQEEDGTSFGYFS